MSKVREVFNREDVSEIYKAMADIIRILCLTYGKLWLSEIVGEVNAFRRTIGEKGDLDFNKALKAIEELEKMGIITLERRIRSSLIHGAGVPDILVDLSNRSEVFSIVVSDEKYMKYIKIREEAFREFRTT